jgi:putative oxidoreductase
MARSAGSIEQIGATILRIALGIIYVMHAYLALFVFGPPDAAAYQRDIGLPFPELGVWYLIAAHGLGGIMMILGVFTRWAALANVPIMFVALLLVHLKQGFFMTKDGGYEYVFLLLAATVAQVFLGGGGVTLRRSG